MSERAVNEFLLALARAVRARLIAGEAVDIDGFGSFRVLHAPSEIAVDEQGQQILIPPRDYVHFERAEVDQSTS